MPTSPGGPHTPKAAANTTAPIHTDPDIAPPLSRHVQQRGGPRASASPRVLADECSPSLGDSIPGGYPPVECCTGTYTRGRDGVWRYPCDQPVPDAQDMTIETLYAGLPILGDQVGVPASLARNEPELDWVLERDRPRMTSLGERRGDPHPDITAETIAVPLQEWDTHARDVVGCGHPSYTPMRCSPSMTSPPSPD